MTCVFLTRNLIFSGRLQQLQILTCIKGIKCSHCQSQSFHCGSAMATKLKYIPNLKPPKKYPEIEFPEKRRLPMVLKVPVQQEAKKQPRRLMDMRGPEPTANFLIHKQYGIRALGGGNLKYGHFEMIRLTINRKMDESRMFCRWRVDPPWKPVTKKGSGHRMGGGKAAIDHYVTPVRAGRIIVEVAGYCEFEEVYPFLKIVAHNLPFAAEPVSQEYIEAVEAKEKQAQEENLNPFSFEYCAKNNFLGVRKWLSPYDYIWHNKYR